ncbi:MAG: sulfate adenylyltransferase [bacterium]|nr:sulfate adenylyltransferase [bacterium]
MNGLLKFITCGSVDDGKSTLIGHILYDTKLLYADQERALELDSRVGSRGGAIDYSLLLDGLMAEREQGITIDVAYRYFTTDRRSFIVADTPGHEEYTRNMAVGASFADLAVILVDATKGVLVQTRRHARICALMGIRAFVFAVNKMDLVEYDRKPFEKIQAQIEELENELGLQDVKIIPLSATTGENLTKPSALMDWYQGGPLLNWLETVAVEPAGHEEGFYMPVQRVCRPDHTFRGFQGQIETGEIRIGDMLSVLPSGTKAGVKNILVGDQSVSAAGEGQPVTIELDTEVDISRGSVLVKDTVPHTASHFDATLLWMDDETLTHSRALFIKAGTRLIPAKIDSIRYTVDVNTGEHRNATSLKKNEIALCSISLSSPIVVDTFSSHRTLGELILIDRITNATAACGIIETVFDAGEQNAEKIGPETRAKYMGQTPFLILADNIHKAEEIERELLSQGLHTMQVRESGEHLLFAADLLQQAGIITVIPGESLDAPTEKRIRQERRPEFVLDLRESGPEKDRLLYENTVNYTYY